MSTSSSQPKSPNPPQTPQRAEAHIDCKEMGRCIIVKEDVDPTEVSKSDLTTDCYFVHRVGGKVDVVRGSAVHIFDAYYDKGIHLTEIEMSGGNLNPKLHTPKLD